MKNENSIYFPIISELNESLLDPLQNSKILLMMNIKKLTKIGWKIKKFKF